MKQAKANTPTKYWNSIAGDRRPAVHCSRWRKHADGLNRRLIGRFLPENKLFSRSLKTDLFDESIGEGLLPFLGKLSGQCWGVDLSHRIASSADFADSNFFRLTTDIIRPGLRAESFDLIVSNSTLDHFNEENDIRKALTSLARLLKPGGHFIWTMDNPANPIILVRNLLSKRIGPIGSLVPYQMGQTWKIKKMKNELGKMGFDIQATASIMHCPRILVIPFLTRLEHFKFNEELLSNTLQKWEWLETLPSRNLTAHYIALHAVKR